MSYTPATYFTALLTPAQLAALSEALAEERQGCEAEPASPLGYWPTAVAALLVHVEGLGGRVKEQQSELSEQEVDKLAMLRESGRLVDALHVARLALEWCYDVTDYPANGTSQQAKALEEIKGVLAGATNE